MILPLATVEDLRAEETWVIRELERMDAAVITSPERWQNRRDSLEDHLADVRAQLARGGGCT